MRIKVETWCKYKYDQIQEEYGNVLNKFGLVKSDDETAYLNINSLEDLFELDKELRNFCDGLNDYGVYFGIVVQHNDKGEQLLEIKDNYD